MKICGIFLLSFLFFFSCSQYTKALKSDDIDFRFKIAEMYYKKGKYLKSVQLFEGLNRDAFATEKGEAIAYYLAYSYYGVGEYGLASQNFDRFVQRYPFSDHTEELTYMSTYCAYETSLPKELTQKSTLSAIEELQIFASTYPKSEKIEKVNELIDELRIKLQKKYLNVANLYFNLDLYKVSAFAYQVLLEEYPDHIDKEEIEYKKILSEIFLARFSVDEKKSERSRNARYSFNYFSNIYPDSEYLEDLTKFAEKYLEP